MVQAVISNIRLDGVMPLQVWVMALGTVIATALGCLMFLNKNHVLDPGGVSAIAIRWSSSR
ncbi:TPA: hypothetical protein ACH3X1_001000 [Trebouxia sp. C0004]